LELFFYFMSRDQYPLADMVLTPEVRQFSLFDFSNPQGVYALSPESREQLRKSLLEIREKIYPPAGSYNGAEGGDSTERADKIRYQNLPPLVPRRLLISGAYASDRLYIERAFSRLLLDKEMDRENLAAFLDRVYSTGNYLLANIRTDTRDGEVNLELLLFPEKKEKTLLMAGGSYQGTLAANAISKMILSSGLLFKGLTGPGSGLLLGASVMDELSFRMLYHQPLSPVVLLSASAEIAQDRDLIASGFSDTEVEENRLLRASAEIKGSFRLGRHNTISLSPEFFWEETAESAALGLQAAYIFDNLDYPFLPGSGLYAGVKNDVYFPLQPESGVYDTASLDIRAAIKLNGKFSITAGAFAGSYLGGWSADGATDTPPSFLGFTDFDRIYFPHIPGKHRLGFQKAAISLGLQFQPWQSLTVLGGQLIFSLSASAGEIPEPDWSDFSPETLIWNASFNTALRLTRSFGLQLKIGIGGDGTNPPGPFISFDIGSR
jgi:NTE family protein